MGSEEMPKVDPVKNDPSLTEAHLNYMRLAQQQNQDRVNRLRRMRGSNVRIACVLGLSVVGIFGYSIWAVGSEKFLDEFDTKTTTQ